MPYLNLRTVKGMLSEQQKKDLMNRFIDALVDVEGGGDPEFRKLVWIHFEESEPQQWQIGDLPSTPEHIASFVQRREAKRKK